MRRGYLSSAASYIPGTDQVKNALSSGTGKAQEGAGAAGYVILSYDFKYSFTQDGR